MKFILLFSFVVFSFFNAFGQERYVKPVDEAKKDASFLAFRTKLIEAAKKRDAKYILSIVDRKIELSFGGLSGIEDFKKTWKINNPKSEFWKEFLTVMTHGGAFVKESESKMFFAPYTFNTFPEDLDAFEYSAIFGNNVNLRANPDLKAKTIAQLSYNVVKVDYENSVKKKGTEAEYSWLKIETLGGMKGFVNAEFVRSPIAYRAGFEKKNGKWKMTVFIAGD